VTEAADGEARCVSEEPNEMSSARVREIYEKHLGGLSAAERLELIALVAEQLADQAGHRPESADDVMALYGAGRALPAGVDAQAFVTGLRDEWDRRPG
jgi:hypothetical protein